MGKAQGAENKPSWRTSPSIGNAVATQPASAPRSTSRFSTRAVSGQPSSTLCIPPENTSEKFDITYLDDTTVWAADGATRIFHDAGVLLDSGASTLELTITRLHVEVSIFSQGDFDGAVALTAVLRGANGSECWRGNTNGEASNWGDPANPLNYQETMSHALDRAMVSLLSNAAFTKALTECD